MFLQCFLRSQTWLFHSPSLEVSNYRRNSCVHVKTSLKRKASAMLSKVRSSKLSWPCCKTLFPSFKSRLYHRALNISCPRNGMPFVFVPTTKTSAKRRIASAVRNPFFLPLQTFNLTPLFSSLFSVCAKLLSFKKRPLLLLLPSLKNS